MEANRIKTIIDNVIDSCPNIMELIRNTSADGGRASCDDLYSGGYILFDVNDEALALSDPIPCRMIVSSEDDFLRFDIICSHSCWIMEDAKQRPVEIGSLLFDAIHGKQFLNDSALLFWSAEQMAISDELGGFTVLFGTQDFLTAEQKNPFPAFDVIIREILSRMAMSDEVRTLLGLKQERDKTANMLLTEGAVKLTQTIETKDNPYLILSVSFSTGYSISIDIVGMSEEDIWQLNELLEDIVLSVPGTKTQNRGEIASLSDSLKVNSMNYSLTYNSEEIYQVVPPEKIPRKKPNFFCDIEALNHLLNLDVSGCEAVNELTVSLIELPFWFSFTQDEDNWIFDTYSQGELFSRDSSLGLDRGRLIVNKSTGEGQGTTTIEELKDNMGAFFRACKNLSCFIQMEHMHDLFKRLDPEKAGILLTVNENSLSYKVVTGKDRPDLTCYTLKGEIIQGRPYMEDFWERSKFDLMDWDSVLKLAEDGDLDAMDKVALAFLNGEHGIKYTIEADAEKAVFWYRKMAEAGSSNGMFNLGLHYAKGYGIERNFEQAAYWMEQAALAGDEDALGPAKEYRRLNDLLLKAEKGDAVAQAEIAGAYMALGGSLEQAGAGDDYSESLKWARMAAEKDIGEAFWVLALAYEHGRGVDEDIQQAVRYYEMGANLGHPNCQHSLGCYYARGEVVEEDHRKAFDLFLKSAEQGYGLAMRDVGRCYQFGSGTMGNMKTAVEWYEKACEVLDDPELAQKTAIFKSLADVDEHWGEDYPGDFDEDGNDLEMPDKYLTGIAPDEVSAAWRYEDELDEQGYLPNEVHGDDAWNDLPRVHQKALEGDQKAVDILKGLDSLG